jgi:hypothetical protein
MSLRRPRLSSFRPDWGGGGVRRKRTNEYPALIIPGTLYLIEFSASVPLDLGSRHSRAMTPMLRDSEYLSSPFKSRVRVRYLGMTDAVVTVDVLAPAAPVLIPVRPEREGEG